MTEKKTQKKKAEKKITSPVIRKLRIEFIIVMMAIVVAFLLVIFGVQYYTTKKSMETEARDSLSAALNSAVMNLESGFKPGESGFPEGNEHPDGQDPGAMVPPSDGTGESSEHQKSGNSGIEEYDTGGPGAGREDGNKSISDFRDRKSRTATLVAARSGSDGSVQILENTIFFIDESDVEGLLSAAIAADGDQGQLEDHDLRYMKRTLTDGTTVVAFTDHSSESSLLQDDLLRSLWIGLAVILVMFLLSLFLSRLTIRPVEKAWDDQRRFVADASHELKTPLTVIMSNTDMVQRSLQKLVEEPDRSGTVPTDKLERNLRRMDNVHEESLRMKELIGELLEVARGDVGQNITNMQELSLSEVANEALLSWESVYYEKGKVLTGKIDEDLRMTGDRVTLRRLIEILIDNALKYSSEKSEVVVSLKKEKSGSKRFLHLSVANEGTPLTDEELSHLFDRFYRADNSREKISGYGLGLSIATAIVAAHKGTIRAEADGTRGNVFHVTFPV